MLNQLVLVGKLVDTPEINTIEDRKKATITISVGRSFKNADGIYEFDNIPVVLWDGMVENATEYLNKGDLIGIKVRLQAEEDKIVVVAEKVTFLSSAKKEEEK